MKNRLSKMIILMVIGIGFSISSYSQFVVSIRPEPPVFVRPIAPSPRHIWVDGEWGWRNGRYEYINGYWTVPEYGRRWIPGHWKFRRGGWFWIPGHWNRIR